MSASPSSSSGLGRRSLSRRADADQADTPLVHGTQKAAHIQSGPHNFQFHAHGPTSDESLARLKRTFCKLHRPKQERPCEAPKGSLLPIGFAWDQSEWVPVCRILVPEPACLQNGLQQRLTWRNNLGWFVNFQHRGWQRLDRPAKAETAHGQLRLTSPLGHAILLSRRCI